MARLQPALAGRVNVASERQDEPAYLKVRALAAVIRCCRTRAEVHELFALAPLMGDYVRLPDGDPTHAREVAKRMEATTPWT